MRFAGNLHFTPVTKMRKRAIEKMRLHHFVQKAAPEQLERMLAVHDREYGDGMPPSWWSANTGVLHAFIRAKRSAYWPEEFLDCIES